MYYINPNFQILQEETMTDRQPILIYTIPLLGDHEYTVAELDTMMIQYSAGLEPQPTFYKLRANYTEQYGDVYLVFDMVCYRWETDQEVQDRLEKLAEQMANKRLQVEKAALRRAEEAAKRAELQANPEYQQFLELQKKFKS